MFDKVLNMLCYGVDNDSCKSIKLTIKPMKNNLKGKFVNCEKLILF